MYDMLCYVRLRMLCYVMLCNVIVCYVMYVCDVLSLYVQNRTEQNIPGRTYIMGLDFEYDLNGCQNVV